MGDREHRRNMISICTAGLHRRLSVRGLQIRVFWMRMHDSALTALGSESRGKRGHAWCRGVERDLGRRDRRTSPSLR
jgi:hypothetical protein